MTRHMFLLFLLLPLNSFAQTKHGQLNLSNNTTLFWTIINFQKDKHTLTYCQNGEQKHLCKIDNKEWYGSDEDTALPKNELKTLILKIGNRSFKLNTSNMFNPNFSGQLYKHQFKLKKFSGFYRLYSFFSDGAGTYTVYWKIFANKSIRELISTDEKDFGWQLEN